MINRTLATTPDNKLDDEGKNLPDFSTDDIMLLKKKLEEAQNKNLEIEDEMEVIKARVRS